MAMQCEWRSARPCPSEMKMMSATTAIDLAIMLETVEHEKDRGDMGTRAVMFAMSAEEQGIFQETVRTDEEGRSHEAMIGIERDHQALDQWKEEKDADELPQVPKVIPEEKDEEFEEEDRTPLEVTQEERHLEAAPHEDNHHHLLEEREALVLALDET